MKFSPATVSGRRAALAAALTLGALALGGCNRTADPDLTPATNIIAVADGVLPRWQELAVSAQTPRGRLMVYGGLFLLIALGELADLAGMWTRRRQVAA